MEKHINRLITGFVVLCYLLLASASVVVGIALITYLVLNLARISLIWPLVIVVILATMYMIGYMGDKE